MNLNIVYNFTCVFGLMICIWFFVYLFYKKTYSYGLEKIGKELMKWFIKNQSNCFLLEKKFTFKNFLDSQNFVNQVGEISENEGHHPDISFGWGYAKINITTHAIDGLSENDFILAAKIDQLINV